MDDWGTNKSSLPDIPSFDLPSSGGGVAGAFKDFSSFSSIFGVLQSGISAYFGAKAAKYQVQSLRLEAQSRASSYQYNTEVSELNAKAAEFQVGMIMKDRNRAIAQYTLMAGQRSSAARASMAARGIALDVGNAAEVMASMDYVKEVDVLTINANSVRAAEAQRMAAANDRANAMIGRASSQNVIASAPMYGGSSPLASGLGSMFNNSGKLIESLSENKKFMSWAEEKTKGWWG